MTSTPLFSVLIANHNDGRYIKEAIESVARQTYPHWEIVIVDDGSTDESRDVYQALAGDARIRLFYNEGNRGCGYTKRRCIELAQGEVCGFLDADDALVPDALQVMVEAHVAHPECSLIHSQFIFSTANLEPKDDSPFGGAIPEGQSFMDFPFSGMVTHFATFKRSSYLATPGINPDLLRSVDVDLFLKLEEVGKLLFIPKPLYLYRTDTGNNLSLQDNRPKAYYWEIVARAAAAQRRGLEVDSVMGQTLLGLTSVYHRIGFEEGQDVVKKSKRYRLGASLISIAKKIAWWR